MSAEWIDDSPAVGGGILVIEDDPAAAEEMVELLNRQFPSVAVCRTGGDGLRKLDSAPDTDLLILDVALPDSTGLRLLQGIRRDYADRSWLQCVFVTGQARREYILDALRQGAVDFLIKPLTRQALLSAVTRGLDRARRIRRALKATWPDGKGPPRPFADADSRTSVGPVVPRPERKWTSRALRRYLAALRGFPGRPGGAVGDPDWIMLLDLLGAERAGQRTTVTALCAASGLPQATALRHIGSLEREGFSSRAPDPTDRRRVMISLKADIAAEIDRYLATLAGVLGEDTAS